MANPNKITYLYVIEDAECGWDVDDNDIRMDTHGDTLSDLLDNARFVSVGRDGSGDVKVGGLGDQDEKIASTAEMIIAKAFLKG